MPANTLAALSLSEKSKAPNRSSTSRISNDELPMLPPM
jgi:hypothetical protein